MVSRRWRHCEADRRSNIRRLGLVACFRELLPETCSQFVPATVVTWKNAIAFVIFERLEMMAGVLQGMLLSLFCLLKLGLRETERADG